MAKSVATTEVKLVGKLDLSMWRGGGDLDDDEDKDSSIDLSPSPLVASSPNHNPINDNLNKFSFSLTTSSQSPSAQKEYNSGGTHGEDKTSQAASSSGRLYFENQAQSLVPPQTHNQKVVPSQQQQQNNDGQKLNFGGESSPKEPLRGGVKKVEFVEEAVRRQTMSSGHSQQKHKTGKGTSPKRTHRSPSGSLLNEIRKMSLASQDAEEEKKKQAGNSAAATIPIKRRIRRKKREEEYTDKDRAAAVTLGSRDIKQSLKAKKKRERKMRLSLENLSSEEYVASMLVVEAMYQLRVRKTPEAAMATLNKALDLQPNHKGALVARSQCHIRLGDANSALKDAETSFGQNETFMQGLYQYAEALYQLGEFEKSLIAFHEGHKLRKDMEAFRIGVQKSQDAIKRAIGDRSATKMSNLDDILSIIEELQESKRKAVSTCKDEDLLANIIKRRYGEKATAATVALSQTRSQKNHWITREVLGQMAKDKEYLAKFIHRKDVKLQSEHADVLLDSAREGLRYLESREKFWRQQNPLYARKTMTNMINNNSLLMKLSAETCKTKAATTTTATTNNGSMALVKAKKKVAGNEDEGNRKANPAGLRTTTMIKTKGNNSNLLSPTSTGRRSSATPLVNTFSSLSVD